MQLSESYKKRISELAGIIEEISDSIVFLPVSEGRIDTEIEKFDEDAALEEAYKIAKQEGVYIYSSKDVSDIAYDADINKTVGALFITNMKEVFSFDVVVRDDFKRQGIGKKLVEIALGHYEEQKEIYGDDLDMEVEVINKDMEQLLFKYGFRVVRTLHHNTLLMKKNN